MSITHRDIKDYAVFLNGVKIFDSEIIETQQPVFSGEVTCVEDLVPPGFFTPRCGRIPTIPPPDTMGLELEPDEMITAAETKPLGLDYLELAEVHHGRK